MVDHAAKSAITRRRILVADDEGGILGFIGQALQSAGYDVSLARDGREALDAAAGADLLLLDLWMPRVSGFEVARALSTNGGASCRLPVIAMSAAYNPDRDGPLGDAVVAFLPKPFDLEDLLDLVARYLPNGFQAV